MFLYSLSDMIIFTTITKSHRYPQQSVEVHSFGDVTKLEHFFLTLIVDCLVQCILDFCSFSEGNLLSHFTTLSFFIKSPI